MEKIWGILAIVIAVWQIYTSKKYFDNIRHQSSPVGFALLALITSLIFAAVLLVYGVTALL